MLLFGIIKFRRLTGLAKKRVDDPTYEPNVTLFVAAYNEKDFVAAKIKNSKELDYPKEKLKIVWVTDGSDDGTPEELKKYDDVVVYHLPQRNGKIGAMNRGMNFLTRPPRP